VIARERSDRSNPRRHRDAAGIASSGASRIAPEQIVDRIAPVSSELAEISRPGAPRTWLVGLIAGWRSCVQDRALRCAVQRCCSATAEIGVRLALGADTHHVGWMMIRDGT
jgi:hypothetical protein